VEDGAKCRTGRSGGRCEVEDAAKWRTGRSGGRGEVEDMAKWRTWRPSLPRPRKLPRQKLQRPRPPLLSLLKGQCHEIVSEMSPLSSSLGLN
jgi:hypothetical protein